MQDIPPKDEETAQELSDDELEDVTGGAAVQSNVAGENANYYREGAY